MKTISVDMEAYEKLRRAHLACCRRRDVARIETYDRGLSAALEG